MKSKKGKALAMKLIDDLLGDGDDEQPKGAKGQQTSASDLDETIQVSKKGQSTDSDEHAVVMDESIEIDHHDPFAPSEKRSSKTQESDETIRLGGDNDDQVTRKVVGPSEITGAGEGLTSSGIKASVGRYIGSGGVSSPTQATLVQSENLRVAQQKILELEDEISRLRTDNEQLAAAGETLKRVADESKAERESVERKLNQVRDQADQEKQLMKDSVESKDRRIEELRNKIEEMELRLSTNIQKIRVRERELENRLELVRMEGQALARSKDEMVLDLKRQIDNLNMELENYRSKGKELNSQLNNKQELLRRTVKALRLALSMLEGDEVPLKKVD